MQMVQENNSILAHAPLGNGHYRLDIATTAIAGLVTPGQFVHVELPDAEQHILRRPFSIFDADPAANTISIVYKVVGRGTDVLSRCRPGETLSLLGPLGRGFSLCNDKEQPVIIAGGYGAAATHLLARRLPRPAIVLIGGRTRDDLICLEDFERLNCTVYPVTEDSTLPRTGLVTDFLPAVLDGLSDRPAIYACGPMPMLRAVSDTALRRGLDAEISLEHRMCCGVGACFACVVKMKTDDPPGWRYVRTCRDGPVFKASDTYWEK